MINLSQIARHFSTDNDQKRSICPKLIAALAQAKSPPNHAPRKGIPGGCGNTPCPKSIATPVYPVQSSRGPPRGILPRISHFSQNRGSDWQYRGDSFSPQHRGGEATKRGGPFPNRSSYFVSPYLCRASPVLRFCSSRACTARA